MYKVLAIVSPGSDVSTTAVTGSPNRRVSFSPVASIASYETSSPSEQLNREDDSPISDSSEINLKRPSFGHVKESILWTDSVILYLKKHLPGFKPRLLSKQSRNILSAMYRFVFSHRYSRRYPNKIAKKQITYRVKIDEPLMKQHVFLDPMGTDRAAVLLKLNQFFSRSFLPRVSMLELKSLFVKSESKSFYAKLVEFVVAKRT